MAKTKKLKKTRVMQIRLSESEADLIYSKARKKCTTLTSLVLKAVDKY
jgi:uncharacterized protein (DUF1778 family)